jgi:AraC-like DNA-binding protein
MKFDSYIPCDKLKPFINSYAIQETTIANVYKVLPGTGLVVGFQYKGNLSWLHNDVEIPLSISGVSGLSDARRIFKSSPGIGTVLVFFKDAGASQFFKEPLHEIFRESVSLDNFILRSELLCVEDQLAEANTDAKRIATVEQFLIKRMTNVMPDKIVMAALSLIYKNKGNIRIKELTDQLYISQSPLEKRFRQVIGASPKKFASIVRFKNIIQQYDTATSLTSLGYEAGFYDQAHFIKEFKTFTGDTPENFFSNKK